ncbi:hypothetical protein GALMADRAFT_916579 [Galerina marginata CBS 339.88]|uniref:Secreted protein n=1 Tax=Galerina marginata (strain CBS 339.88) TaxID=685588 RepID=A0A067SHV0_GALM3|nr:hypothetical protein GALMADRAFT_916579 [Galerina marginata CBS 339.88]
MLSPSLPFANRAMLSVHSLLAFQCLSPQVKADGEPICPQRIRVLDSNLLTAYLPTPTCLPMFRHLSFLNFTLHPRR